MVEKGDRGCNKQKSFNNTALLDILLGTAA